MNGRIDLNKCERIEMSEKTSLEIAENFFEALKTIFKVEPLKFSCKDSRGFVKVFCDDEGNLLNVLRFIQPADEENDELPYTLMYKDKIYVIEVVDDEELYGYCSCLTNIDRSTYVFCNIVEKRKGDKIKKCEMDFAFDIEKGTFLELFCIEHFNNCGIIRECQNVNYIESLLYGKQILEIYTP